MRCTTANLIFVAVMRTRPEALGWRTLTGPRPSEYGAQKKQRNARKEAPP
jgi:hypothetical protein